METWRLLDTGARTASENMALDEVLLELKAENKIPKKIFNIMVYLRAASSILS